MVHISLFLISILEGITEFLPVSSTAHLIIAGKFLSVDLADEYIKFFLLFIQLGALLAGVLLFARKIFSDRKLFINICVSFIPTAVVGLVLYKLFKQLLEGNMILIALMLFIGGIIFIYLEKVFMRKGNAGDLSDFGTTEMTYTDAFIIGVAQAVAIVPGVSRSGATIIAGIFRGIKKSVMIEYTFFLAIPTLGAAILYDAYKSRAVLSALHSFGELFFGCLIAFVTAVIVLWVLKKYMPKISLTAFGWYRILLAIFVFFAFVIR